MRTTFRLTAVLVFAAILLTFAVIWAQTPAAPAAAAAPELPKPQTTGGKPLMQCLAERHTSRAFAAKEVSTQTLSNLLWAAFGVNRPTGQRTAPSANNWQETDIYVATKDGLFLFEPKTHSLKAVLAEDIRPLAGSQPFVATAPVILIYVADYSRMGDTAPATKDFLSATDVGYISQNVYLYAASEDLATVVCGLINRTALLPKLNLRKDQKLLLIQPVGYPAK